MKHAKLQKTIIIRFPMYCDAQPPPKKPKMDPRQKIAPKLNHFLNKHIKIVSKDLIPIQEMSTVVTSILLSYPCFRLYVNWEVNPNPTPFERIDKQAHMAQKILWK